MTTVGRHGDALDPARRSEVMSMSEFDCDCSGPDWLTGEYTNKKWKLRKQLEGLERAGDYA